MFNRLGVLALVGFLAACSSMPLPQGAVAGVAVAPVAALDVVTLINTDKTIADHAIGMIAGKDCSSVRSQQGGEYCQNYPAQQVMVPRRLFCYRTMGSVDCYEQPLPGDHLVGTIVESVPVR